MNGSLSSSSQNPQCLPIHIHTGDHSLKVKRSSPLAEMHLIKSLLIVQAFAVSLIFSMAITEPQTQSSIIKRGYVSEGVAAIGIAVAGGHVSYKFAKDVQEGRKRQLEAMKLFPEDSVNIGTAKSPVVLHLSLLRGENSQGIAEKPGGLPLPSDYKKALRRLVRKGPDSIPDIVRKATDNPTAQKEFARIRK